MGFLSKTAQVKDLALFRGLSKGEVRDVMRAGQQVTVPQGWSLIAEKTPGDAAYLLLDGRAVVFHEGEEVAELGRGDIVGEIALRAQRLRTATVSAKTPLTLLRFSQEAFSDLTQRIPAFRGAVDDNVAQRLRDPTS